MPKFIDITGQRFGKLVATSRDATYSRGYWNCACDCGREVIVYGGHLRCGSTKTCGHCTKPEHHPPVIDISSKKFGKLTAVSPIESPIRGAVWRCICECGNSVEVKSWHLRTGKTKSCGCLCESRKTDITDQTFHRLTVIGMITKNGRRYSRCVCSCGNEKIVRPRHLINGLIKSCGCYRTERSTTHGSSHSITYSSWSTMIQRCTNPNNDNFKYYGARGIDVCDRWHQFDSFLSDMGHRPSVEHTLERINNDLGYHPGNVKWLDSHKEQMNNTRRNVTIEYGGEKMTMSQWADKLNLRYGTLSTRLRRGWSIERAFNQPIESRR